MPGLGGVAGPAAAGWATVGAYGEPATLRQDVPVTAQPGIFALGTAEHLYLDGELRAGAGVGAVAAALADVSEAMATTGGVNLVVGFRPELWPGLAEDRPDDAVGFNTDVVGPGGYRMPATQHDVWLWVAGASRTAVFDAAIVVRTALAGHVDLVDEHDGWVYAQDRDLTGFVDGTENPAASQAPAVVAPGGAGSVLLVQTWRHDIDALSRMSVREQELMMGRTKADSVELDDDTMPASAHVARTTINDGSGAELHIFRRNTATGTPTEHGTQFVGFSADRARLQLMLDRMAGAVDGIRDALTAVATAVTGAYYYVPSLEELAEQVPT